jgi:hypothetical protein
MRRWPMFALEVRVWSFDMFVARKPQNKVNGGYNDQVKRYEDGM